MTATTMPTQRPAELASAVLQLETIAALLSCQDPERSRSLGGPSARGVAALVFRATADLESSLDSLLGSDREN